MKKAKTLLNLKEILLGLTVLLLQVSVYAQTTFKYKCYQSRDYNGNVYDRNEMTHFSFNGNIAWESEADGSEKVFDKGKYEYKLNDI